MKANSFKGPLFIVGMPRSGTKLLRNLLNQHPGIGIPVIESHFFPFMINQFGYQPHFDQKEIFDQFYAEFTRTAFFWNMKMRDRILTKDELGFTANLSSWASIFEVILKFYVPPGKDGEFIWGDKTPGYLQNISLLRHIYPRARFLHIIRDPRDYCLSVRKTWKKNIFRAADAWQKKIEEGRLQAKQLGSDYKEIRFEDLLDNPELILPDICHFIDCAFDVRMLTLDQAAEYFGDAKGHTEILRTNKEKYEEQLTAAQIERIEEIVYPVAISLNYQIKYADKYVPLSQIQLRAYNLIDGWASIRFHIDDKGLRQGISYFYNLHKRSSWR